MSALRYVQAMQTAMDDQARDVWHMVEYSRASGYRLTLGEVTLTELNFYRLRNFWTRGVYIDVSQPNETTTGADWEWLIGHGDKWLQIRVQAKVISANGSFRELGHPKSTPRLQMDRLIDPPLDSVLCRWMPLYVFYTATPPARSFRGVPSITDPRHGCSAKPAHQVRAAYGPHYRGRAVLTSRAHLPGSVPWSSIFNGLVQRLSHGELFEDIVDSLANQKFSSTPNSIDSFWDPSVTGGACTGDMPEYMKAIFDKRGDDFDDAKIGKIEVDLPPAKPTETRKSYDDGPVTIGRSLGPEELEHPPAFMEKYEPLPVRKLKISASRLEEGGLALPRFISIIDIDELTSTDLTQPR